MEGLNRYKEKLKELSKKPMLVFPTGAGLLVLFVFTVAYARGPQFPDDLPSAQTLDIRTENVQSQADFSNRFASMMRRSHGGLLLVKQTDRVAMVSGTQGHGYVQYLQKYNQIREARFLDLAQQFSNQEGVQFKVKKSKEAKANPSYELSFLKEGDLWVKIDAQITGQPLAVPAVTSKQIQPNKATTVDQSATVLLNGPKLVVVIDNLGQNIELFNLVADLSPELTLGILPQKRHSQRTALEAHQRGIEVMIQMPMQPVSYPATNPGKGALLDGDDPEVLASKLKEAFASVPYATGMNNHMGSSFTANPEGMALVMQTLSDQGLFYLNSRTASTEVPQNQAERFSVPFYSRSLYIDSTPGLESARAALLKAVELAKSQGSAVAIGRPKPETLQALKELLPQLKAQGVQLVRASSLKG